MGGAINNYGGYLYLTGCTFESNYTTYNDEKYGGAIGLNNMRSGCAYIINCGFLNNYCDSDQSKKSDLGVYSVNTPPSDFIIAGCSGITITPSSSGLTTEQYGAGYLDYSNPNDIKFVYEANDTSPVYSLVVNGAAYTTHTGALEQIKSGTDPIETITFTADDGFSFDPFEDYRKNGIDVVRTSETEVTISGTLTDNTSITIHDAVEESGDKAKLRILKELYDALGNEVWTGYGVKTGVISYSRGDEENEFRASFMGGAYTFDVSFDEITSAEKTDEGEGNYIYNLVVPLPAYTGMETEELSVSVQDGKITELESKNAEIVMNPPVGDITGWSSLNSAMGNGGVITLSENISASGEDTALTVPADKTVVLDLNGHTIDRGLTDATEDGSVIINNGILAIMDSSAGESNPVGNGRNCFGRYT
ncbi:MAG: hypothetical protein K6G27_01455 [Lachnospiraceae bacterium]|nr:hypothetical protein [Lachnospiraceae bacterium]